MKKRTVSNKLYKISNDLRLWLAADEHEDDEVESYFEHWYQRKESGHDVIEVGRNLLIDRSVFQTRFLCVPQRCAPGPGQGKWRCCCADVYVPLTPGERKRLAGARGDLAAYMARHEPRLIRAVRPNNGRVPAFWLDEDGDSLAQPNGRCVFSRWDSKGRIRCHLHGFAKRQRMATSDVQPYTCRLFPLLVIRMGRGKLLLTVLNRENYRAWDSLPPWRFPCLSDDSLPPLLNSMAGTLDWVFGEGFVLELRRQGRSLGLLPR